MDVRIQLMVVNAGYGGLPYAIDRRQIDALMDVLIKTDGHQRMH